MSKQPNELIWEEFSLTVNQDLADSVKDVLTEILPSGLVTEKIYGDVFPDQVDQIDVPVRISGYLPVDEGLDETRTLIQKALEGISRDNDIPAPNFTRIVNQDWATAWQVRYKPIPLGNNLIIVPSWLENPHPERLEIKMDPGMAFGSGTHPTTQLSLTFLEDCLQDNPLDRVIDIGTGSGILAIAAKKLGAASVLGVDNDPEVIKVSQANAELNQIYSSAYFHPGSVAEVLGRRFEFKDAPLVVVNIIAPILRELFQAGLDQLVSPNGELLLSGILEEQLGDILGLLDKAGFIVREKRQMDDWVGIRAVKPAR